MQRVNTKLLPATTRKTCEQVAAKTDTCTISISRGKDSIACLMIVREYFSHIVPYYMVNIPTKEMTVHEKEYLEYCEQTFGLKIRLYVNGDVADFIGGLIYQPWQDIEKIDSAKDMVSFDYTDLIRQIQAEVGCQGSWGCRGIKACDSGLLRRMFTKRQIGIREEDDTFYPIYDWSHDEVFQFIADHGVKLPCDYMCHNKTIMGVPIAPQLEWLKENIPEDYAKILQVYPMIETQIVRNEFRRMKRRARA